MADKNTVFQQKLSVNIGGNLMDLSTPKIMGIVNLTPDSFYDGGRNNNPSKATKKAEQLLAEGADILDLGAYSSRPGAEHISELEELERLLPVVNAIVKEFPDAGLSIDTFRSGVARAAIDAGAHVINDISGGELDKAMFAAVAALRVPYILMHMRGTPQTMASQTKYQDITSEVCFYFAEKIADLKHLGVIDIIIDPGFGFAKTPEQSYELLKNLDLLKITGHPVLAGLSRKSMIYKTLGTDAENALTGTIAANTIALMKGANLLRVHDVRAAKEAITIFEKVR
ncbi:dihydropteroate synthase [Daejeonella lutea]|uniref:Dihydropteroate synthase n=2 Tax=Daejeonella lutea TaxID=572036 RepID=A0A1T5CTC3_9SPHI|nr:dihydropteroate synthase [Daejeonella lutea]